MMTPDEKAKLDQTMAELGDMYIGLVSRLYECFFSHMQFTREQSFELLIETIKLITAMSKGSGR